MAQKTQPNERTEREFAADVNTAVANTEAEIFGDALGDEELDNDADTSLEEMGEGLEGHDLEEEEEAEEIEGEEVEAAPEGEEPEEAEGDEAEPQGEPAQEQPARHEIRGVAPGVHRQERDRRRTAETEAQQLRDQLAEMRGRLDAVTQQVNAPRPAPQQQEQRPDPQPDMFADPEGWKQWNERQTQARIDQVVNQRLGAFQQSLQQREEQRLNQSFHEVRLGPRGYEFDAAYRALTSLDPRNAQNQAAVARIRNSNDPAQAFLEWWDNNGGPEYREAVAQQFGFEPEQPRQQGRSQRGAQPRQQSQQPRQTYRVPPSLNSARGGGNRVQQDPDMMDDSDEATFRFATR